MGTDLNSLQSASPVCSPELLARFHPHFVLEAQVIPVSGIKRLMGPLGKLPFFLCPPLASNLHLLQEEKVEKVGHSV